MQQYLTPPSGSNKRIPQYLCADECMPWMGMTLFMGANFHPHLRGLVSKGSFDAHGVFYPLPWIDTRKMALLFRDKVFSMLIREEKITEDSIYITKCRSMAMMRKGKVKILSILLTR